MSNRFVGVGLTQKQFLQSQFQYITTATESVEEENAEQEEALSEMENSFGIKDANLVKGLPVDESLEKEMQSQRQKHKEIEEIIGKQASMERLPASKDHFSKPAKSVDIRPKKAAKMAQYGSNSVRRKSGQDQSVTQRAGIMSPTSRMTTNSNKVIQYADSATKINRNSQNIPPLQLTESKEIYSRNANQAAQNLVSLNKSTSPQAATTSQTSGFGRMKTYDDTSEDQPIVSVQHPLSSTNRNVNSKQAYTALGSALNNFSPRSTTNHSKTTSELKPRKASATESDENLPTFRVRNPISTMQPEKKAKVIDYKKPKLFQLSSQKRGSVQIAGLLKTSATTRSSAPQSSALNDIVKAKIKRTAKRQQTEQQNQLNSSRPRRFQINQNASYLQNTASAKHRSHKKVQSYGTLVEKFGMKRQSLGNLELQKRQVALPPSVHGVLGFSSNRSLQDLQRREERVLSSQKLASSSQNPTLLQKYGQASANRDLEEAGKFFPIRRSRASRQTSHSGSRQQTSAHFPGERQTNSPDDF